MDLSLPPDAAAASMRAACEEYGFLYGERGLLMCTIIPAAGCPCS